MQIILIILSGALRRFVGIDTNGKFDNTEKRFIWACFNAVCVGFITENELALIASLVLCFATQAIGHGRGLYNSVIMGIINIGRRTVTYLPVAFFDLDAFLAGQAICCFMIFAYWLGYRISQYIGNSKYLDGGTAIGELLTGMIWGAAI
jgi:hypothetical protein